MVANRKMNLNYFWFDSGEKGEWKQQNESKLILIWKWGKRGDEKNSIIHLKLWFDSRGKRGDYLKCYIYIKKKQTKKTKKQKKTR